MSVVNSKRKTILHLVVRATAGKDGRRGVNGPEVRILRSLDFYDHTTFAHVICYSRHGRLWPDFLRHREIELVDFEITSKYQISTVWKIVALIKRFRPSIIHTQGSESLDLFAAIAAASVNIPLIVTRPNVLVGSMKSRWRGIVYRLIDSYTMRQAARVVAVSNMGYQFLRSKLRVSHTKVVRIYNGVDVAAYQAGSDRARNLCIGTCAQLSPQKGWEDFLEVVRRIIRLFPKLRVVIVGDGPMRDDILERATALGIKDRLSLVGFKKDVRVYLREMDVFLLTSFTEGFPVAILEAMASGLPVVATDVGGVGELVLHGKTGYLTKPREVDMLTRHVKRLLEKRKLRKELGGAARKHVRANFTIEKMVRGYEELYTQVAR
jgi:glycosyltransferase involved in cell wall biosynthesis